jgi:hypothetical protein
MAQEWLCVYGCRIVDRTNCCVSLLRSRYYGARRRSTTSRLLCCTPEGATAPQAAAAFTCHGCHILRLCPAKTMAGLVFVARDTDAVLPAYHSCISKCVERLLCSKEHLRDAAKNQQIQSRKSQFRLRRCQSRKSRLSICATCECSFLSHTSIYLAYRVLLPAASAIRYAGHSIAPPTTTETLRRTISSLILRPFLVACTT